MSRPLSSLDYYWLDRDLNYEGAGHSSAKDAIQLAKEAEWAKNFSRTTHSDVYRELYERESGNHTLWFYGVSWAYIPPNFLIVLFIILPIAFAKIVKCFLMEYFNYVPVQSLRYVPVPLLFLQQSQNEKAVYVERRNNLLWLSRKKILKPEEIEMHFENMRIWKKGAEFKDKDSHWVKLRTIITEHGVATLKAIMDSFERMRKKNREWRAAEWKKDLSRKERKELKEQEKIMENIY